MITRRFRKAAVNAAPYGLGARSLLLKVRCVLTRGREMGGW